MLVTSLQVSDAEAFISEYIVKSQFRQRVDVDWKNGLLWLEPRVSADWFLANHDSLSTFADLFLMRVQDRCRNRFALSRASIGLERFEDLIINCLRKSSIPMDTDYSEVYASLHEHLVLIGTDVTILRDDEARYLLSKHKRDEWRVVMVIDVGDMPLVVVTEIQDLLNISTNSENALIVVYFRAHDGRTQKMTVERRSMAALLKGIC